MMALAHSMTAGVNPDSVTMHSPRGCSYDRLTGGMPLKLEEEVEEDVFGVCSNPISPCIISLRHLKSSTASADVDAGNTVKFQMGLPSSLKAYCSNSSVWTFMLGIRKQNGRSE